MAIAQLLNHSGYGADGRKVLDTLKISSLIYKYAIGNTKKRSRNLHSASFVKYTPLPCEVLSGFWLKQVKPNLEAKLSKPFDFRTVEELAG